MASRVCQVAAFYSTQRDQNQNGNAGGLKRKYFGHNLECFKGSMIYLLYF